jgi:hypothetical protein
MHASLLAIWAGSALLLSHSCLQVPAEPAPGPELSAQDRQFLESLLKDVVFDPRDATAVRCEFPRFTLAWGSKEGLRDGWLVKGKSGAPDRVFFSDGFSIPAPQAWKPGDFLSRCRRRFSGDPQQRFEDVDDHHSFLLLGRDRAGIFWREEDLTLAAWLFRLGQESLAARALAAAREEAVNFPQAQAPVYERLKSELRRNLAWKEFETLVCAFSRRADETALVHGEHLLQAYPDVVTKEHPQASRLVAELRRRKKAGRFGQEPPEQLPAELEHDPKKALAWLIDALDEVDAGQWGQPGWVELNRDWRVRELVKLGEPAVADLIEVVANDQRLCRSLHCWRNFSRDRTILGVSEAALEAISSILKTPYFEPQHTADNFTRRGEAASQEMGRMLRQYWRENAKLTLDERMMKMLLDPQSPNEFCQTAAKNLARFHDERLWGGAGPPDGAISGPNPCLTKFKEPTTAEAILRAFDRDRGRVAAQRPGMMEDEEERQRVCQIYMAALRELDDGRIVSELTRRTERERSTRIRLEYAETALRFRSTEAVDVLARQLERGKIVFPPAPSKAFQKDAAAEELVEVVALLTEAKTPETEWALDALTRRNHPSRPTIVRALLAHAPDENEFHRLYSHPFVVTILRQLLDDTTSTGGKFRGKSGTVEFDTGNGKPTSWNVDPQELSPDWRGRQVEVQELVRDRAMTRLGGLMTGVPTFHALRADAHNRVLATKVFLDRFKGRFRLLRNAAEREKLDWRTPGPKYIPDIPGLEKPATAFDVEAGRAVFHFAGRGKRERIIVPAWIILKSDADRLPPPRGLVVQAERGDDGEVTFGVIFLNSIQTVRPAEIERWEPYQN